MLFRPVVRLEDRTVAGFQALTRWRHPRLGVLEESEFGAAAESTGAAIEIGAFALETTARELAAWQKALEVNPPIFATVGASSPQMLGHDLLTDVRAALSRHFVQRGSLKIAVAENLVMENPEYAAVLLRRVREIGAALMLDRFGAGYTSLGHLPQYRFDAMRIDASLVQAKRLRPALPDPALDRRHGAGDGHGRHLRGGGHRIGRGRTRPDRLPVRARGGVRPADERGRGAQAHGRGAGLTRVKAGDNRVRVLAKTARAANLSPMKFPPEFLDEIRARLPVSEVVARRVKLRKQGREWAGLSPFNAEKTPSFFVNDQKGFYHDFSSGKHGDVFRFLMETEGLSFPDAVERLAGQAGVPMPRMTSADVEQEKKRASLLDVLAMAARLFEANLHGPVGAKARGYLSDRGLGPAVQQRFQLGYSAPDRFALRDALAAQGVGADQMIEAGLLIHGEGIAVPYDRFRDRVMFPIHDRAGKVDRLRRPGDGAGRQGQVPQFAGDAALPQGLAAVQPPPGAKGRARFRRRSSWSRATSTRSR